MIYRIGYSEDFSWIKYIMYYVLCVTQNFYVSIYQERIPILCNLLFLFELKIRF